MLSIQCMDFIENGMILGVWDINRIYQYEFGKNKICSLIRPFSIDKSIISPYGQVYEYKKGNYLFAPLGESHILLYDSINCSFRTIELEKSQRYKNKKINTFFCEIVSVSKYLLLIPCAYEAIIRFDCETEEVEYFYECVEEIMKNTVNINDKLFFRGYAVVNGMVYLACFSYRGHILRINPENMTYDIVNIAKNSISICGKDDNCWLLTDEGELCEWNINNCKLSTISKHNCKFGSMPYQEMVENQKWVILIPWESNQLVIYDKELKKEKLMDIGNCSSPMGMFGKIRDDEVYIFFHKFRQLYTIDLNELSVKSIIEIDPPADDEVKYWEGIYGRDKTLFSENGYKSLEQFISNILEG